MNKIFSLILCFSLVIGPVTVHAEAMDAYTKESEECKNDKGACGSGSNKGIAAYMLQTAMIANAAVGVAVSTCIPSSYHWAHWIYTGGAAAYIVGEVAMASEKTDYHKKKKESIEIDDSKLPVPGTGGSNIPGTEESKKDFQTTALQAALDEEINNKEMMEKRVKWALAVAIIYDIATIAAGVEAALSVTSYYSGFFPDVLTCAGMGPIGVGVAIGLAGIYTGVVAADHSKDGTYGLDAMAFQALLLAEVGTIATLGTVSCNLSWGRIVFFGQAAIMAHIVAGRVQDRVDIAKKNIAKLENALAQWKGVTTPTTTLPTNSPPPTVPSTISGGGGGNTNAASNYITALPKIGTALKPTGKCMSSEGKFSSPACKNFKPMVLKTPKFQIDEINQFNQKAMEFTNAARQEKFGEADLAANGLLQNAARIKAVKDQVLKEAQAALDKQGGKKQDLLASINAQHNSMMKSLEANGAKSGFGSVSLSKAVLDPESNISSKPLSKISAVAPSAGAATPAIQLFSGAAGADEAGTSLTGLTTAEQNALTTDYENNKGAYLSTEKDSLFQVLSKTYIRNLDRILVRKKSLEEVKPVEKPEE
jgi:hypothetical protein